jgi:hypothetical protein
MAKIVKPGVSVSSPHGQSRPMKAVGADFLIGTAGENAICVA